MNYTVLFSISAYNLSIVSHTLILQVPIIVPWLLFQQIPPPEKSVP